MAGFFAHERVEAPAFCPEDAGLGTPRGWPDIHGGDGMDVLEGRARVLDPEGHDLTEGMIAGGEAMVRFARSHAVDFAILLDMSGACATQVISDGSRFVEKRAYRRGVGVAAACLVRAGVPVVSQRDFRTLDRLQARLDPGHVTDPEARAHHETEWYRGFFGEA